MQPFIEANTVPITLDELKNDHIIPVFTRNNQPLISQGQFVDLTMDVARSLGPTTQPEIRVSHPIKGRIPSASHKDARDLEDHEKTLYFERCMFITRIPSITKEVDGHQLTLVVGGVKAYNLDKINGHRKASQHFKVFIGFQVKVCSNLCVWTDGAKLDLKVDQPGELSLFINELIEGFNPDAQLNAMQKLKEVELDEQQFAHLIGKCRMYPHLPYQMKRSIPGLSLGDSQVSRVVKMYYSDPDFGVRDGKIDLWSLYNLFTAANKSSYLDSVLDKHVNAAEFVGLISDRKGTMSWYFN